MRSSLLAGVVLCCVALLGRAQTAQERKLNLAAYGLVKPPCAWYPGDVDFLDDDHLVISAPVAYTCSKSDRDKPVETKITAIDLEGHQLATTRRSDVVEVVAGPIGYAAACTGDHIDLLSSSLQIVRSIPLSGRGPDRCYLIRGLSSSRTSIAIRRPSNDQISLYQISSGEPVAQVTTSKGQSVEAVAEDGFLLCIREENQCDQVGPSGILRSFTMPELAGASGSYVVGLVAPDKLVLGSFDGRRLYAETPNGGIVSMGDVAKLRPPFIGSSDAAMSAAEPRRILYRVDGCPLGDFDDCYGVLFRRFAVYDSLTSRTLIRHSYSPDATLKISPNGHIVMERVGPEVRLFYLP